MTEPIFDRRSMLRNMSALTLSALPALPALAQSAAPLKAISSRGPGRPLQHYWSRCVGAGRANEGLRASWLEQLALAHKLCGFQMCRFHGLFHDDMFVVRKQDGQLVFNWQYVDELFDRMLSIGVRPFVELGFMPSALASGTKTQFWWKGNITPPAHLDEWGQLVTAFARHVIARYGIGEVKTWYFEVWNEPNLGVFWDGTRTQYFELYKTSALALKAVDNRLRVGGPATSNFVGDARFDGEVEDKAAQMTNRVEDIDSLKWKGVWIESFLAFCKEQKLPVDFVSSHPYPTDFALNPGTGRNKGRVRGRDATPTDLRWLHDTVRQSAYPQAEIHLTEWSSSPSSRDHTHDYLQAAAYIAKMNLDGAGLADSLSYWVFSDIFEELGGGSSPFHGGFGLINFQGIVKPAFHAYRMLNALGDELLEWRDGVAVTRHSATGKITVLLVQFPEQVTTALSFGDRSQAESMLKAGSPRRLDVRIEHLPANASFLIDVLDRHHGNAVELWQQMGAPTAPDRAQIAALKEGAMATRKDVVKADAQGVLDWSEVLPAWTCMLMQQQ